MTFAADGVSGGSGTYSYAWEINGNRIVVASATFSISWAELSSFSISGPASYPVVLTVTDSNGSVANASFSLVVDPTLTATPSASHNPADVSESTTIFANVAGGTGTYTNYAWSGLPSGCSGTGASFSCAPSATGTYSVSVTVTDSSGGQASGSFSLTVDALLNDPIWGATLNPMDLGQSTSFSTFVSGGSGTYTQYAWSGLPTGCPNPGSVTAFVCTPTATGFTQIVLTVTDSNGNTVSDVADNLVFWVQSALTVSPSASSNPVDVGTSTVLSAGASGGSNSYPFDNPYTGYAWTGLPAGCPAPGNVATFSCTPTSVGDFTVGVTVSDANHNSVANSFQFVVDPQLVPGTPSASPNPFDYPQTGPGPALTLAAVDVRGGTGSYTYVWNVNGVEVAATSSASVLVPFSTLRAVGISGPGDYPVLWAITDSSGASVSASFNLVVEPPLTASPSASHNPVDAGAMTAISANAGGGTGTYTSYAWSALPPGCAGNGASFSCAASAPGAYAVSVNVTDSAGGQASASFTLTVAAAVSIGSLVASPNPVPSGASTLVQATGIAGGGPPYSYSWSQLPPGCANPGNTSSFSCAPGRPGVYTVELVVTDSNGGSANRTVQLTVGPAVFPVTFSESGLPSGTPWTVQLGGAGSTNATVSSITFELTNGTYGFSIPWLASGSRFAYVPSPWEVSITLQGLGMSTFVAFTQQPLYELTVRELGLPIDALWSVTFGTQPEGNVTVAAPVGPLSVGSVQVLEPNGSVQLSIHAPSGYGVSRIIGRTSPSQTLGYVVGTSRWTLVFGAMENLTFVESNLTLFELYPGASWSVNLVSPLPGGPAPAAASTNGQVVAFTVAAGSVLRFAIVVQGSYARDYQALPSGGRLTVPAHPLSKPVKFHLRTSTILFTESGVPAGVTWTVTVLGPGPFPQPGFGPLRLPSTPGPVPSVRGTVNTTAGCFTCGHVRLLLPNGTYDWWVNATGYSGTPASGTFSVVVPARLLTVRVAFLATPSARATLPLGGPHAVAAQGQFPVGIPAFVGLALTLPILELPKARRHRTLAAKADLPEPSPRTPF